MDTVTRQPVPAAQRGDTSIVQAAEPAFGRRPDRTVCMDQNAVHGARPQPVDRGVRFADLPVGKVGKTAEKESYPETSADGICGNCFGKVLMSESYPRNGFARQVWPHTNEARTLIRDPDVSSRVFGKA